MSRFRFTLWRFTVLTFVFSGLTSAYSQSSEEINLLVENLLKRDFRQIQVNQADTVLTSNLLLKAKRSSENRNDSAIFYSFQAVPLAEKAGLISEISRALEQLGQFYMTKENFSEAINSYILGLKLEEKRENQRRMADFYDLLGAVYFYQEIFPKAFEYNQNALSIYQNLKDTVNVAKVLDHLGSLYNSREFCEKRTQDQTKADYEKALDYYQQSLKLLENKNYKECVVNACSNMGNLYRRMGKLDLALEYVQKAVNHYRETKNMDRLPATIRTLGQIYNRQKKYDLALACLLESQEIGVREKQTDGIQFLYEDIAQIYENQRDYKNSLKYYKKYMILRDSIYNNQKSIQIFELETKYQAEKKQAEIEKLTLVKRQGTLVIYILIAAFLIVSLFGWNYFRNIRSKKIIADQKLEIKEKQLLELEKERQLTAAKSVLQGEEAERSRLAGDLHDGLGGLLTGVKLKLSSMKENSIITSENLAHFNHALDLLDTSITEMRRVAHNLMPETLMHYGLQTALSDFIKQVEPEGLPIIRCSTFGANLRYEKEIEITLYRIAQELVTNAIKHADAKQIDIQLFTEKDRICVQVNDNGIGFDPEGLDLLKTGKGLKNIRDRVTAFNGRFELISQTGKGTECTIEFLI
jgi:two-component system NarL family sensor kinase